jgi:hypothetical protein
LADDAVIESEDPFKQEMVFIRKLANLPTLKE